MKAMEDSDYDSDDDADSNEAGRLDMNRLTSMKEILFNIHRSKTGENKLCIREFIDSLIEISQCDNEGVTFSQILFD